MADRSRGHSQSYRKEYSVTWPVLVRSMKSSSHVFCTVCKSDFTIAHGGKNDCLRHIEGSRHRQNAMASSSNQNIKTMFQTKENLDVIKAESLFLKFLIEHNLPLSTADHAGPLFKQMFPDSDIASKYACARTKSTEILKSFASTTKSNLYEKIKKNKFSLATDGSNSISDQKLFPIVITFYDEEDGKVKNTLLSLPQLEDDATGENIFGLLESEIENNHIPWTNCIGFSADNAAVMLGEHKGVGAFIKKKNPNAVIHGCACHLIHLTAQHASKKLSKFNVENFLIDVFYYLKKSTKRQHLLKLCEDDCGLENKKLLKYGSTRWLSMGKVIDRFIEQWEALKKFVNEENSNTPTFIRIKQLIEAPETELYLAFLQAVIPVFESANALMQNETPMVYKYQRELLKLYSAILSRFINPASIIEASTIVDVNFTKRKNQKDDASLVIGARARQFLHNNTNIPVEKVNDFYDDVRAFYNQALSYMKKKFPLTEELFKHCEIADISLRHTVKFESVEYFFNMFSIPMSERCKIEEEFAIYQVDELQFDTLECDQAWHKIGCMKDHNGALKYENLTKLMHTILLLPHSNAACERIFSVVKKNLTDMRSSMSLVTLESILIEKCMMKKSCYESKFTEAELNKAKQATYYALNKKQKK